jgi:large subunit ribosomal protein L24
MKEQVSGFPAYKKNDVVQVISGKYKGKSGKILRLLKDKNCLVVEKINIVKRHTKPSQANPQGGIIEKEAPLQVSKVLPVSSKTGKPMRFSKWLKENSRAASPAKGKKKERGAK